MAREQSPKRASTFPADRGRANSSNGATLHLQDKPLPGMQDAPPRRAPNRRLPVVQNRNGSRAPRNSAASETQLRYWLASLVRLSDNIVQKAVTAYDRLFELKSEDQAEIYLEMAREFERDGKTEEVLEALRKAAVLRPEDGRIRMKIGMVHLKGKAPAAAVQAFQKARELGYSSYRLHFSLAHALAELNQHELALHECERALTLNPHAPDVLHKLGMVLDQLGRFQEAVQAFQRAVDLVPHEVSYHQSLGFALESAGRRSDAVKCFKRALELEQQLQGAAE